MSEFARAIDEAGSTPAVLAHVPSGVYAFLPGARIINNRIHDCRQGIDVFNASGSLVYGNVVYHNGWRSSSDREHVPVAPGVTGGHGHGMYTQNETGAVLVHENLFVDQFGYNMHCYGTNATAYLNGFDFVGNISLNSRWIIGGYTPNPVTDCTMGQNFIYSDRIELGFEQQNNDLDCQGNWLYAEGIYVKRWRTLTFRNNTIYGMNRAILYYAADAVQTVDWDYNTYYVTGPNVAAPFFADGKYMDFKTWQAVTGFDAHSTCTATVPPDRIMLRPNAHQAGRAHVVIENWSGADNVAVDVSALALTPTTNCVLRNAQNMAETLSFAGNETELVVPTSGWTVAKPVGWTLDWKLPLLPRCGAFVLESA